MRDAAAAGVPDDEGRACVVDFPGCAEGERTAEALVVNISDTADVRDTSSDPRRDRDRGLRRRRPSHINLQPWRLAWRPLKIDRPYRSHTQDAKISTPYTESPCRSAANEGPICLQ